MTDYKNILETLIEESHDIIALAKSGTKRQIQFSTDEKAIKVAIGMRRVGKTYFLYQTIIDLLHSGVSLQQILLVNFEDERLLPMAAKQMGELLDAFYTLHPENHNRRCYIFLDEIQNVQDWQLVVRRYLDSKNVQLYLTGSSSKLLSTEIATSLRGRSLATEVWPFSFKEFLLNHDISEPKTFGQKTIDIMHGHLIKYFTTGGFPAVQHMPINDCHETLRGYIDTVILRDIIERHHISNTNLLRYLIAALIKNAACAFSVNKFFNDIKRQGYKTSKDTIHQYMSYIEEAYLSFSIPFYSESKRQKQNVPKKIYAIDNGIINLMSLGGQEIFNKYLENQVYLDLRRQGKEIYFYNTQEGYEVDFVSVDKAGHRELIQVTLDMSDEKTAEREQRALESAQNELGLPGRIITLNDYLRCLGEL